MWKLEQRCDNDIRLTALDFPMRVDHDLTVVFDKSRISAAKSVEERGEPRWNR